MAQVIIDITTPGNSQVTIASNVTGDTTIICGGPGGWQVDYSGLDRGGNGGGGCAKRTFTIAGGTVLDCVCGSPIGGIGTSVVDHATGGTNVNVYGSPGAEAQDVGGGGGGDASATGAWATGSAVLHFGGVGADPSGTVRGGGSGGCPTADGITATTGSGAASAGPGSGAGSDGSAVGLPASGANGSQGGAGGGAGNGTLSADGIHGLGGNGSIRIIYNTVAARLANLTSGELKASDYGIYSD